MSIEGYGAWEAVAGRYHARPMHASDLPDCVRLFQFEFRDPSVTQLWHSALKALLSAKAIYGAMVENRAAPQEPAVACGLGFFLSAGLFTKLERCPSPLLDRTLAECAINDLGAILLPDEIGRANATTGLHLLGPFAFDDRIRGKQCMYEVWQALAQVGRWMHSGYRLASINNRVTHGEDLRVILSATGGRILNSIEPPESLIRKDRFEAPVIISVSREQAVSSTGTYASTLFVYTPPRFRFAVPEQSMLRLALVGVPDKEIAHELSVSDATIKKRWESIYDRVLEVDPDLLRDSTYGSYMSRKEPQARSPDQHVAPKRGPEKRYRLLRYLVNHLEELRPFDFHAPRSAA